MKHPTAVLTLLAVLASAVVAAAFGPASPQGQGPGHQVELPPVEAWSDAVCSVNLSNPTDGSVRAAVWTRTDTKRVSVDWSYFPNLNDPSEMTTETQNFTTRYFPTYACGIGTDKLCVAGVDGLGKTVLELWAFDVSNVEADPPTKATRTSVTTLINEVVAGRYCILQFVPSRADPDVLLMRYHDSRDVYAFDTGTQVFTKVAGPGPTEPSGVIVVPELAGVYASIGSRDHVTHGYAYIFRLPHASPDSRKVVVLIDSDRDGDLDSGDALTATEWDSGGWADPANYQ